MKCLRKDCPYQAKPDRVYCSPDCARLDRSESAPSSESEAMDVSSSREDGEPSEASCAVGPRHEPSTSMSESMTQSSETPSGDASESSIESADPDTSSESGWSTGSSVRSSDDFSPSEEDRGADGLIQLMGSLKPQGTSQQEKSNSMSLIDDSAKHLHELMKSVGHLPKPGKKVDPARVKMACEAARQMTSLLRLKLDILREFRR